MGDPDTPTPPVNLHLDRRAAGLAEQGTAAGNSDEWLNTVELADYFDQ